MKRATFIALARALLGAGIALLIAALRQSVQRLEFRAGSVVAEGRVVGFREQREELRPSFFPRIEFITLSGVTTRFESGTGSEQPAHRVGDAVSVRYRVAAPNEAALADFFSLWGFALVFGGLGACIASVGAG